MPRLLSVLLLIAFVAPVHAQTILGGGPASFSTNAPAEDGPFVFDGPAFVAGLYSPNGWLQGIIGTDTSDPDVRTRVAGVDLAHNLGSFKVYQTPRPRRHRRTASPSARLSIPVRLSSGYRYLSSETARGEESIQIADGRLGIGAAVDARFPVSEDAFVRTVNIGASVVGSAGVNGQFSGETDVRGLRDLAVLVDVRLSRIGRGRVGLAVGYEFRRTSASRAPLDSAGDFVDALTDGSTLFRSETLSAFRVGLTW